MTAALTQLQLEACKRSSSPERMAAIMALIRDGQLIGVGTQRWLLDEFVNAVARPTEPRRAADTEADFPDRCLCITSGPAIDGPDETCPEHGRPYGYWVRATYEAEAKLVEIRQVVDPID